MTNRTLPIDLLGGIPTCMMEGQLKWFPPALSPVNIGGSHASPEKTSRCLANL